jgi:hypothetical protein
MMGDYGAEYRIIDAQFNNCVATENTLFQLYQLIDKILRDPQVNNELKDYRLENLGRRALMSAAHYGSREARHIIHKHRETLENEGEWHFKVQTNGDFGETIVLVLTRNQCKVAQTIGASIFAAIMAAGIAKWYNKKRPSKPVHVAKCAGIAGAIAVATTTIFCYSSEIAEYLFGPTELGWLGSFREDIEILNYRY